ncbi:PfkB family carbohydrate kinase [Yinghuangia sp. ASG 101]|uniref:carbohydrate kinase family protein n=1 Tax=Yinghuangia sp. ASG 101 TaxID=2896848 RepID=UPI001E2AE839|nr:PfkB family carbohydrate kinase [Yinghuangia sp. ASG 101]UGQ14811.1 PfkB family carbohydrate kinase [Yinghuangia sp. ASG 101]
MAGAYFADLIFRDLGGPVDRVRLGGETFAGGFEAVPGGAFTPALALHRLGHDVVWATDFGDDPFSRMVLAGARAAGLDETGFRHHERAVRSVTVVLSYPTDRAMVSFQDPVAARPLDELARTYRPRVLLLPELRYGPGVADTLRAVRDTGALVFMDCQDVPVTLATPTVRAVLEQVDVFAPNAAEALRLTGAATVDDAAALLARSAGTAVVKCGADGAVARGRGKHYTVAAAPVRVVDTTGAGDCFNAGFVHGLLTGRDLAACLETAVACGASATTAPGSTAAPDTAALAAWRTRVPPARAWPLTHTARR